MRAALLLLCSGALQLLPLAAGADDRPDFAGECHPPVLGVIDADWRRDAQRFKEATLRTFARHEGNEEGGRRQLKAALQLSEVTRVSAYDVLQLTRELMVRGLKGKDLEGLRAAALDAQTALGSEGAGRFVRAQFALRGRGAAGEADLKDLEELLGRGLYREALGRRLGGRGDPDSQRGVAAERLQGGAVDGTVAALAAQDALLRYVGQAQAGEAARAALTACVAAMSRTCPRKDAEEHCHSTPREYLELLQR